MHSEALKEFMQWFRESSMAKRALQCCSQFERKSSKGGGKGDRYKRNIRAQLRVALAHTYGSSDWMNLLLAAGAAGINEQMVQAFNAEINHRTPGGAHGVKPFPGPRLSKRNQAKAQGEVMPPREWRAAPSPPSAPRPHPRQR